MEKLFLFEKNNLLLGLGEVWISPLAGSTNCVTVGDALKWDGGAGRLRGGCGCVGEKDEQRGWGGTVQYEDNSCFLSFASWRWHSRMRIMADVVKGRGAGCKAWGRCRIVWRRMTGGPFYHVYLVFCHVLLSQSGLKGVS